jgi:hypothetical protein
MLYELRGVQLWGERCTAMGYRGVQLWGERCTAMGKGVRLWGKVYGYGV